MEKFLVITTTTVVKHYEIKANSADEARNKVALNPGQKFTATDTQTIIDDVEKIED